VPNLVIDGVPAGGEDDYVVLKHVGAPPELGFDLRDHLELGTALGMLDMERGAKASGAGSLSSPGSARSSGYCSWPSRRPSRPVSP
jgi:seryl-tRNA synthetase